MPICIAAVLTLKTCGTEPRLRDLSMSLQLGNVVSVTVVLSCDARRLVVTQWGTHMTQLDAVSTVLVHLPLKGYPLCAQRDGLTTRCATPCLA